MVSIQANLIQQVQEVVALSSIYGSDWSTVSSTARTYSVRVKDKKKEVLLTVTMPPTYPSQSPPTFELSAPWMERKAKGQLFNTLNTTYLENNGVPIIFLWTEKIRETLQNTRTPKQICKAVTNEGPGNQIQITRCPDITHGEVIMDRKSSFQGHAAAVHSLEEVKAVLAKLKENKKIRNAKHNVFAYRFDRVTANGTTVVQDCDDDGEAQASGRLLQLLQKLDQRNTLVIVTRWFGGIQLGQDRFRHYNNAMRQAIEHAGLLKKKGSKMRSG